MDESFRSYIMTNDENCYDCVICHKIYKSFSALTLHLRSHIDRRLHACNIGECNERCDIQDTLVRHETIINEKRFQCSLCDKSYKKSRYLRRHMTTHIDEDMCFVCSKKIKCKEILNRRRNIDNNEEPVVCLICINRFKLERYLNRQIQTHAIDSSDSEDQCGRSYECPLCDRSYKHKTKLHRHILLHFQEKPVMHPIPDQKSKREYSLNKFNSSLISYESVGCSIENTEYINQRPGYNLHIKNRRYFKIHKIIHNKKSIAFSAQCAKCYNKFPKKFRLSMHMTLNTQKELYRCAKCIKKKRTERSFSTSQDLLRALRIA